MSYFHLLTSCASLEIKEIGHKRIFLIFFDVLQAYIPEIDLLYLLKSIQEDLMVLAFQLSGQTKKTFSCRKALDSQMNLND